MTFDEDNLDLIFVPAGIFIMVSYNLYFLYRVIKYPATTVIGFENHNWMAWVEIIMKKDDLDYTGLALSVLSSSSGTVLFLASLLLSLCGFTGVWVGNSGTNPVSSVFLLGNTSSAIISLKDISIILAFLLSFGVFLQSTRCYVLANTLITMPKTDVQVSYVQRAVLWGNNFWEIGLRVLYLAMALLFWSFGPITMFACCVITVIILYFLDQNTAPLHPFQSRVAKRPATKAVEEVGAAVSAVAHRGHKFPGVVDLYY